MTRKKGDAPGDNYPLRLTEPQREALLHHTRLTRSAGYSHLAKGKSARPAIVLSSE